LLHTVTMPARTHNTCKVKKDSLYTYPLAGSPSSLHLRCKAGYDRLSISSSRMSTVCLDMSIEGFSQKHTHQISHSRLSAKIQLEVRFSVSVEHGTTACMIAHASICTDQSRSKNNFAKGNCTTVCQQLLSPIQLPSSAFKVGSSLVRRAYPTCAWTHVQCKLSGLGSHIKVPTGVNQADEASTDLRTLSVTCCVSSYGQGSAQ